MAEEWMMVRVTRTTRARLEAVRLSLMRAHDQGKIALEMDPRDRVSVDQVVNILIDARAAHADRRLRSRRKARVGAGAGQLPHPGAQGGPADGN